jgi:hypothetical protein
MTNSLSPASAEHKITNPALPGLLPVLGLVILALLGFLAILALVLLGRAEAGALLLAGLPLGLFVIILAVGWLLGERQARQMRAFWASDRPQVRWVYTETEWATLRDSWRLPTGCLATLLGAAGLLAGALVAENNSLGWGLETLLEMAGGALLGGLAGALAGGTLGAVVALGNWLAARRDYRQAAPGAVALSRDELYALDQYSRLDGESAWLEGVEWEGSHPARLILTLGTTRPRQRTELWELVVPDRMRPAVEAWLQQMPTPAANPTEE